MILLIFLLAGIESAVINYLHTAEMKKQEISKEDVAASFQKTVVNTVVDKTMAALRRNRI